VNLFKKVKTLAKRRKNAKKIGIKFTRAAAWKLPKKILINNRAINLHLINDGSTSTSFIDIFLDDVYGLHFFKSYLPEVKKIIDIGANQGLFTLAAKNIFPAQIHAYEPNPEIIKYLKHHADLIQSICFNEAVGLTRGRINIQKGKDSLHSKVNLSENGNIIQVPIADAISRMNGDIDLLKLDCEGAEWEILKDTASLKKVKAITLEYHLDEEHNHDSIKEILQNAGFKILHYEISGQTWGIVWTVNNE
jgi:FkbM family methyltransferase